MRIIHDRKDDCTAFRHILYGKFSNDLKIDFRRIAIIEIYTNFSKANLVFVVLRIKGNQYSTTTIVAAITSSKKKKPLPTHVTLTVDGLEKRSIVLPEQLRTVDIQRLGRYVGTASQEEMEAVDKAAAVSIGLKIQEESHDDR